MHLNNKFAFKMNICGPLPLKIKVCSVSPVNQLNESKLLVEPPTQKIDTILPSTSKIIQTQNGLVFKGNAGCKEKRPQEVQIYEIVSNHCNQNTISIQELLSSNVYPIYKVVQNGQEQQLMQNDVIKIGYFQLYVRNINLGKAPSKPIVVQSVRSAPLTPNSISQNECNFKKACRICLQNSSTKDDPLLCLCKCSGSVKYTHFECLKIWYNKFLQKQESDTCSYYHYNQGECQICKEKLPLRFTVNNKRVSLASFQEQVQIPHIVFQLVNQTQQQAIQIIVLKLQNRPLIIGQSQQADLCFLDQSVGEIHCEILFKNNKVYICDKQTLFGTLIKLREFTKFSAKNGISLRIHNLQVKLERKSCFFNYLCADQSYNIHFEPTKKPISEYRQL